MSKFVSSSSRAPLILISAAFLFVGAIFVYIGGICGSTASALKGTSQGCVIGI